MAASPANRLKYWRKAVNIGLLAQSHQSQLDSQTPVLVSCHSPFRLPLSRSGHALKDGGDTLTATDAHGDQCVPTTDSLQFVQGLDRDQRAGRSNGMTQRDA